MNEAATKAQAQPEEKKPEVPPIDVQIKGEIIKSLSLAFPALAYFKNAMDAAKSHRLNIVLPVVFTPDGRIAMQEPIIVKQEDIKVPETDQNVRSEAPQAEAEATGHA